jgi:hypothetical protein
MSWEMQALVWKVAGLSSSEKYVLLSLADHADRKGRSIFPGAKRTAQKTGLSERTVRRAFAGLRRKKLITIAKKHTQHFPTEYMINITVVNELTSQTCQPDMSDTSQTCQPDMSDTSQTCQPDMSDTPRPATVSARPATVSGKSLINLNNINCQSTGLAPQQELVGILSSITGIDYNLKNNASRLGKVAAELLSAGYLPEDIEQWFSKNGRGWWYRFDWRGKQGQSPTLGHIAETVGKAAQHALGVDDEIYSEVHV